MAVTVGAPLPTTIGMGLSAFLRGAWYVLFGIAIAMVVLYRRDVATENGIRLLYR